MLKSLFFVFLSFLSVSAQNVNDEFFETKIRPVLAKNCYACHSSKMKTPMGALVLDSKAGTRQALVPGKPEESRIVQALRYPASGAKMPPSGKLPDEVIADFERWIAGGAPDPRQDTAAAPKGPRVITEKDLEEGRKWWAFQPVRDLPDPAVNNTAWIRKESDAFVLARLEKAHLKPSPEAGPRTLIRRVYLDLTGLKPTFEEVEAYANDPTPDRYERLVDRLLASPHYGERWARYWLDIVRYAEDNVGNITNPPFPHAWRYRDWVIHALNKDVPYDRFVKLQLAADLMKDAPREDLPALGYMGLAPVEHKDGRLSGEVIGTLQLNDMDERVDAVSRSLLGLTVACARCHDHKFDPIPTRDYYRLEGVFASTQRATRPLFKMTPEDEMRFMWLYQRIFDLQYTANLLDGDPGSKPEQAKRQVKKFRGELAQLDAEMDALGRKYPQVARYMPTVRYPGEKDPDPKAPKGRHGMKHVDAQAPFLNGVYDAGMWLDTSEPDLTLFDYKPGEPRDLPVYRGGNIGTPLEAAHRGFLTVLSQGDGDFHNGSGRLELATKIFTDAAPLSARVIVNRVWGWHFDRPLAATPSDFGTQGEKPTHPDMLADLAARFIANGWSLKWLHREILLSATYRQASHPREEAMAVDPANRLLWRMNPRRIDIEAYRDSLLEAAGNLDLKAGGPSDDLDESNRRTIYARISRSRMADLFKLYDVPEPVIHNPMRSMTISPTQQLFVMNSPFIRDQAATLAKAVESETDRRLVIRKLYRRILARDPDAQETDLALGYLDQAGLPQYTQALLATNEVIFWP